MAETVRSVQDAVLAHRRAAHALQARKALDSSGGAQRWTGCDGAAWRVECNEDGTLAVATRKALAPVCQENNPEQGWQNVPCDSALASHAVRAAKLRTLGERGVRAGAQQRAAAIRRRDAKCAPPPTGAMQPQHASLDNIEHELAQGASTGTSRHSACDWPALHG